MPAKVSPINTSRFIDRWAYVPLAIASLLLFLSIFGSALGKTLINKKVKVSAEEPVKVGTIDLSPKDLGALRIDAKAFFPDNHWIVYEIRLIDVNGEVVASAIDEAWRESGRWREGSESGSWSESELLSGLDIRTKQAEKLTVIIEVLESGTASGQPANLVVNLDLKIKKGAIKSSHLLGGLFFTGVLGVLSLIATGISGQKAIFKKINDSDPNERATVGGEDNLVKVSIKSVLDETTPRQAKIDLYINNVYGERIYKESRTVPVAISKNEDGEITKAQAKLESLFVLKERSSYGFTVRVEPDNPVEWTSLTVLDGSKTLRSVEVKEISY